MGRTLPERNRVILGCVRLNGAVETEATDIEVPSCSSGSQTDAKSRSKVTTDTKSRPWLEW